MSEEEYEDDFGSDNESSAAASSSSSGSGKDSKPISNHWPLQASEKTAETESPRTTTSTSGENDDHLRCCCRGETKCLIGNTDGENQSQSLNWPLNDFVTVPAPAPAPKPIQDDQEPINDGLGSTSETATKCEVMPSDDQDDENISWTSEIVTEAERNLSLAQRYERTSSELARAKLEMDTLRRHLLQGINGGATDSDKAKNINLISLLRLREQEIENDTANNTVLKSSQPSSIHDHRCDASSAGSSVQILQRKLATERQRSRNLERQLKTKDERVKSKDTSEVEALKAKVGRISESIRTERELRARCEKENKASGEKNRILTEQHNKCRRHLQCEAKAKREAIHELSLAQREVDLLQERLTAMQIRNNHKDQAISDLKEQTAVLDTELKSMIDKYSELRIKVNWTRSQATLALKAKKEEVERLQAMLAYRDAYNRDDTNRTLQNINTAYEHKSKIVNSRRKTRK